MQHVQIPHELVNLKKEGRLELGDQVIFAAIKKYMNAETRECFPSITTIAKTLKCSRLKILSALDRLAQQNLLTIKKEGKHNRYFFERKEFDNFFEMFTEEFLKLDMPLNIKEYYMSIQQFLYDKESGVGKCSFSNVELAKRIGISVNSVKKYNEWLVEHRYLNEETTERTDEAGLAVIQKNFNLSGLQQAALWIKAVNDQLVANTDTLNRHQETITEHSEELERLRREVKELQRKLNIEKRIDSGVGFEMK